MLPKDKVQNLIDRHFKLENELSSGEIEKKKYAEISKEYSDLNYIIKYAKEYLSYENDINDLNNIINDKSSDMEMKDFARSELEKLKKESFNLRFQKAGGQLENTARVRFVRRSIARILTVINSKVEKV